MSDLHRNHKDRFSRVMAQIPCMVAMYFFQTTERRLLLISMVKQNKRYESTSGKHSVRRSKFDIPQNMVTYCDHLLALDGTRQGIEDTSL